MSGKQTGPQRVHKVLRKISQSSGKLQVVNITCIQAICVTPEPPLQIFQDFHTMTRIAEGIVDTTLKKAFLSLILHRKRVRLANLTITSQGLWISSYIAALFVKMEFGHAVTMPL